MLMLKFESNFNKSSESVKNENVELFETMQNLGAELVKVDHKDDKIERKSHIFHEGNQKIEIQKRTHEFIFNCKNENAVRTFIQLLWNMDHEVELEEC